MQLQGDSLITYAVHITVLRLRTNCLGLLCGTGKSCVSAGPAVLVGGHQTYRRVRETTSNAASNPQFRVVIFLHVFPLGVGLSSKRGRTWLDQAKEYSSRQNRTSQLFVCVD